MNQARNELNIELNKREHQYSSKTSIRIFEYKVLSHNYTRSVVNQ